MPEDQFMVTVEVVPPPGPDAAPLLAVLEPLAGISFDAFSVATNPVANIFSTNLDRPKNFPSARPQWFLESGVKCLRSSRMIHYTGKNLKGKTVKMIGNYDAFKFRMKARSCLLRSAMRASTSSLSSPIRIL